MDKEPKLAGAKTVNLPSGKVATIHPGKGLHAKRAIQDSNGKPGEYLSSLMAQLIEIDGKKIIPEDLDDMDLQDYMTLQTEFADQNFK